MWKTSSKREGANEVTELFDSQSSFDRQLLKPLPPRATERSCCTHLPCMSPWEERGRGTCHHPSWHSIHSGPSPYPSGVDQAFKGEPSLDVRRGIQISHQYYCTRVRDRTLEVISENHSHDSDHNDRPSGFLDDAHRCAALLIDLLREYPKGEGRPVLGFRLSAELHPCAVSVARTRIVTSQFSRYCSSLPYGSTEGW